MASPTVGSTATTNLGTASSHAINLPSHSEGDLLLMVLQEGSSRTATVSTWTEITGRTQTGAGSLRAWAKMAGAGGEGDTKTVSWDNTTAIMACVTAISGAADFAATPIVGGATGGTAANIIAPSITATDDDSLVVVAANDGGGTGFSGTLSGYTLIANLENSTSFDDMVAFYRDSAAAAGSIASQQIATDTGYSWSALTLAIAPAVSGASAIPAFIHHRKLLGVQ